MWRNGTFETRRLETITLCHVKTAASIQVDFPRLVPVSSFASRLERVEVCVAAADALVFSFPGNVWPWDSRAQKMHPTLKFLMVEDRRYVSQCQSRGEAAVSRTSRMCFVEKSTQIILSEDRVFGHSQVTPLSP